MYDLCWHLRSNYDGQIPGLGEKLTQETREGESHESLPELEKILGYFVSRNQATKRIKMKRFGEQ
jgi:hypothetical protein